MDIRLHSDHTWSEIGSEGGGGGCLLVILFAMYCGGVFDRCSCVRCSDNTSRNRIERVQRNTIIGYTIVNANVANLRNGPGTKYDYYFHSNGQKMQVNKGCQLDVIEEVNGWLKIITPDGGTAYIKKSLCTNIIRAVEDNESEVQNTAIDDDGNGAEEATTEIGTNSEVLPQPEVGNNTSDNSIVETKPGGLINARLGDVVYDNGYVKITIMITTPMVRRQFGITKSSAKDGNGEYVHVSDVIISGINKERGRGYYIITDNDIANLTIEIPQMPESGNLSEVRVDLNLSGSIDWTIVKNIGW